MKKFFQFLLWVIIIIMGIGWLSKPTRPPQPPPVLCRALSYLSPPLSPPLLRLNGLVELLGIVGKICILMNDNRMAVEEEQVRFRSDENRYFSPVEFADKHGINDKNDVQRYDRKVKQDLRECTDKVLNSGESVYNKQLEMRSECLKNKGYDDNDQTYIDLKFPTSGA